MGVHDETCDFCAEAKPGWWYPSQDVLILSPAGPVSMDAGWALCDDCALFVVGERWDELLDRQVAALESKLGQPPSDKIHQDLETLARGFQMAFQRSREGSPPPHRRTPAPQALALGGDLTAYSEAWRASWRQAPAHLVANADGRAAHLRDALGSWGVDVRDPVVRRTLWGVLAIFHAEKVAPNETAALSALLSSLEVGT